MLGASALGRPRGMLWGGRREEGSGWGAHIYLRRIYPEAKRIPGDLGGGWGWPQKPPALTDHSTHPLGLYLPSGISPCAPASPTAEVTAEAVIMGPLSTPGCLRGCCKHFLSVYYESRALPVITTFLVDALCTQPWVRRACVPTCPELPGHNRLAWTWTCDLGL